MLFVTSYTNRLNQRAQVEEEIAAWERLVEEAEQKRLALQAELAYVTTNDYVDEVARESFGMAKDGDKVIVVLTATPMPAPTLPAVQSIATVPVSTSLTKPSGTPFWQQWLSIFAPNRPE